MAELDSTNLDSAALPVEKLDFQNMDLQTLTSGGIDFDAIWNNVISESMHIGKNILFAVIIYFVGRYIIKLINRILDSGMQKRNVDPVVKSFIGSLVNIVLVILLVLSVIATLGVQMTSFAALLASAGVAIGMALSGNLQNFAGGLVILLLRPYKIGDYIEINGEAGVVKEIQIFNTIILTVDNKTIFIPNNAISSGVLVNYSHQDIRRVDLTFAVSYGTDFKLVKNTLERLVAEESRIIKSPEVLQDKSNLIVLGALADSSVNVDVKLWVKTDEYWDVRFDLTERVYATFNAEGIEFPFPQLTVHQAKD